MAVTTSRRRTQHSARGRSAPVGDPKFELIDIAQLEHDPNNLKVHNPRNIGVIGDLLQDVGAWRSIGIDENNRVMMGNGVVEAAQERGFRRVLVVESDGETLVAVRRSGLSEDMKIRAAIGDNRSSELSTWDKDKMVALLAAGSNALSSFWNRGELARMLPAAISTGLTDPDAVPDDEDLPPQIEVSAGEIFALGRHRLMCGDSTRHSDVLALMDGVIADGMWTDPPYGVGYVGKTSEQLEIANDDIGDPAALARLLDAAFVGANLVLAPGSPIYVAHPCGRNALVFGKAFMDAGWLLHEDLVWVKDAMVLGHSDYHMKHEGVFYGWKTGKAHPWVSDRTKVSVFEFAKPAASEDHPTMKPVELITDMLGNNFAGEGVIFEPFSGSGSTLIACEQLGLTFRGIELSPIYAHRSIARWECFTGQKAEKVS